MSLLGYSRSSSDSWPVLYFVIGIAALWLIGWIWSSINDHIKKRVKEISDREIAARMAEVDKHQGQLNQQFIQLQREVLNRVGEKTRLHLEAQKKFEQGYSSGRQWLAAFIAEAEASIDLRAENWLKIKSRPAPKAAEQIKQANQKRRSAMQDLKFLEYQLASYKEYFPVLTEYENIILEEYAGFRKGTELDDPEEDIDRSALYLSREEYQKLPPVERNQRALDAYNARNKHPWEIGRMYERYLGYLYESKGWDVTYHGALAGFEDMGRDLICLKDGKCHIVQAKCWSKEKTIREKHLFQLYGTCLLYEIMEKMPVKAVFIATTKLSEIAVLAAQRLKIEVRNQELDFFYPQIKCNINQGKRIYHLPFDQQYDRVKIILSSEEFYALTVAEAEAKGFRRAKRYKPSNEA